MEIASSIAIVIVTLFAVFLIVVAFNLGRDVGENTCSECEQCFPCVRWVEHIDKDGKRFCRQCSRKLNLQPWYFTNAAWQWKQQRENP